MKVTPGILECIHLDPGYALLSIQNVITCMELFRVLDIHLTGRLNDIQFWFFIREFTDLARYEADLLFKLLDVDHSGEMDFEEFYLVFCIIIACKDECEKEFIYRHSRSIFRLVDSDASGHVSHEEFTRMGVLFNFNRETVSAVFKEFDISKDKDFDFGDFRIYALTCIDKQKEVEEQEKVAAYKNYQRRLLASLEPLLKKYIVTKILPTPTQIELHVDRVPKPYIVTTKKWKSYWDIHFFLSVIFSIYRFFTGVISKITSGCKFLYYGSKKVGRSCLRLHKWCCKRGRTKRSKFSRRKVNPESYRDYNRRKQGSGKTRGGLFHRKTSMIKYVPSDAYLPVIPQEENAESENREKKKLEIAKIPEKKNAKTSGKAVGKKKEGTPDKQNKSKQKDKPSPKKNVDTLYTASKAKKPIPSASSSANKDDTLRNKQPVKLDGKKKGMGGKKVTSK